MYRFSLVILLLDDRQRFEGTLASVLRSRPESCQIIVAHDGSYDDPHRLAGEVQFVSTGGKGHLIQLLNCGLKVARGEVVGLLRPGAELSDDWFTSIDDAFSDPDVGCVSPAMVDPETQSLVAAGVTASRSLRRRLVGRGTRLRSIRARRLNPLGPTSWAGFYRSSLLNAVGFCDENLDPMFVDLDLALSLQSLRFRCEYRPDCIVEVADRDEVLKESERAHGISCQRAMLRHRNLGPAQQLVQTLAAVSADIISTAWWRGGVWHALQRTGGLRYKQTDNHHRQLIELVKSQRRRLVESNRPVRRAA